MSYLFIKDITSIYVISLIDGMYTDKNVASF